MFHYSHCRCISRGYIINTTNDLDKNTTVYFSGKTITSFNYLLGKQLHYKPNQGTMERPNHSIPKIGKLIKTLLSKKKNNSRDDFSILLSSNSIFNIFRGNTGFQLIHLASKHNHSLCPNSNTLFSYFIFDSVFSITLFRLQQLCKSDW